MKLLLVKKYPLSHGTAVRFMFSELWVFSVNSRFVSLAPSRHLQR